MAMWEDCDICADKGIKTPAVHDAKTKMGLWAYMCEPCHVRVAVKGETKYRCIADRYDFNPENTYTLEEFQAMCLASFGGEAPLTWDGEPDQYRDETGVVVLEAVVTP